MSFPQIKVETARLRLRELDVPDAPFVLQILNEPAFIRNVGDREVRTEEAAANYIRARIQPSYRAFGFGLWLVERKRDGEPLGICGLLKRDALEDVDIGFSFLECFWKNGFAREAAIASANYGWNEAGLHRLIAITVQQNTGSIRLLEKLGMRFEKLVKLTPDGPDLKLFAMNRPTPPS